MIKLNLEPLTGVVALPDIRKYKLQRDEKQKAYEKLLSQNLFVVVMLIFGMPVILLGAFEMWFWLFMTLVLAGVVTVIAWRWIAAYHNRLYSFQIRLQRFAEANNFTYYPRHLERPVTRDGLLLAPDTKAVAYDLLEASKAAIPFELGNVRALPQGKIVEWGYIRIELSARAPHLVLDSKQNDRSLLSSLPETYRRDQHLRLEGDFNEFFTLYAPKDSDLDALYILTPDIMEKLVHSLAKFDVEIIGTSLYLYSPTKFQLDNPQMMKELIELVDMIAANMRKRTGRLARSQSIESVRPDLVTTTRERLRLERDPERFIITVIFALVMVIFGGLSVLLTVSAWLMSDNEKAKWEWTGITVLFWILVPIIFMLLRALARINKDDGV